MAQADFFPPPVLEGPTLRLRPLRGDDWDALYAIGGDPELWAQHPAHERWQEPIFREYFDYKLESGGTLLATRKADGAVLGTSSYSAYSENDGGSVEVGATFIGREWWGTPVNAEMKRLMLAHAFRIVERVRFQVGEGNMRSRKAMEKIGARLTGETNPAELPGRTVLHVIYQITRDEFASGPLA